MSPAALHLTSALTLLWSVFSLPENEGTDRIVGGQNCLINDYPFMVSLRYMPNNILKCGGTLIRADWILTAAHCTVRRDPTEFLVVGGTSLSRETPMLAHVHKIYAHRKFIAKILDNDISLLRLKTAFIVSGRVGVALLTTPGYVDSCKEGTVLGWGVTEPLQVNEISFQTSTILQCVNLPLISIEVCTELWKRGHINQKTMICTLDPNATKDACKGDSGGPLLCNGILVGIVSKGEGCARKDKPGVYTRVDQYLDYIQGVIENCCAKLSKYIFLLLASISLGSFIN